jgi:hypothetical protein
MPCRPGGLCSGASTEAARILSIAASVSCTALWMSRPCTTLCVWAGGGWGLGGWGAGQQHAVTWGNERTANSSNEGHAGLAGVQHQGGRSVIHTHHPFTRSGQQHVSALHFKVYSQGSVREPVLRIAAFWGCSVDCCFSQLRCTVDVQAMHNPACLYWWGSGAGWEGRVGGSSSNSVQRKDAFSTVRGVK